jgi:hypothetical protein
MHDGRQLCGNVPLVGGLRGEEWGAEPPIEIRIAFSGGALNEKGACVRAKQGT